MKALRLFKKKLPTRITSVWGLNQHEADANWIRVEKSVMSKYRRDQVVRIKNKRNGACIYVPIRGAGNHHSGMFRQTVAMSYDNRARLEAKASKGLDLEISPASWLGVVRHNMSSQNSEHAAVYQISLVSLVATVLIGLLSLI